MNLVIREPQRLRMKGAQRHEQPFLSTSLLSMVPYLNLAHKMKIKETRNMLSTLPHKINNTLDGTCMYGVLRVNLSGSLLVYGHFSISVYVILYEQNLFTKLM